MKKLFEVTVTKTIYVIAEDGREAELEAMTYESEENGDIDVSREITSIDQVSEEWKDALPFGGEEEEVTIRQMLLAAVPPPVFVDPPEQLRMFPEGTQPI